MSAGAAELLTVRSPRGLSIAVQRLELRTLPATTPTSTPLPSAARAAPTIRWVLLVAHANGFNKEVMRPMLDDLAALLAGRAPPPFLAAAARPAAAPPATAGAGSNEVRVPRAEPGSNVRGWFTSARTAAPNVEVVSY